MISIRLTSDYSYSIYLTTITYGRDWEHTCGGFR